MKTHCLGSFLLESVVQGHINHCGEYILENSFFFQSLRAQVVEINPGRC